MRSALLVFALLLLAGCARSPTSSPPSGPASGPAPPTTGQKPGPTVYATQTKASIDDQPIRTPAFTQKYDEQLKPGEMLALDSSRPTKHNLTVTMKATPGGAKVSVAVLLKQDFDNAKAVDKKDIDPKAMLAYNEGGDNVEVKAAMPAVLPYMILLRNTGNEMVKVEVMMKAQ